MAQAPTRPCTQMHCPNLAEHGTSRCTEHPRKPWAHNRSSREARGYDNKYRRIRDQYRRAHPDCETCGADGTEVDHIIPLSQGGARLDPTNLQTLCQPCHTRKTQTEARRLNKPLN